MIVRMVGHFLFGLGWFCIFSLFAYQAFSAPIIVFEVKKSLPLYPQQKVYRDFYLNAGQAHGLKKGLVVTVYRRLPMHDTYQNKSLGNLEIAIAQLRILHVEANISVARVYKEMSRDQLPLVRYEGIMLGDRVDMEGAFVASRSAPRNKKAEAGALGSAMSDGVESSATSRPMTRPQAVRRQEKPAKDRLEKRTLKAITGQRSSASRSGGGSTGGSSSSSPLPSETYRPR